MLRIGRCLYMTMSMAAKQACGKQANDVIFATNSAAQEAAKKYGADKVLNGTVGSILDDDGHIVFLKAVKDEYLNLPETEYITYAPIAGLPSYCHAVVDECFGESKPDAYIEAIATAGGTGCIHHLVHNYTSRGDEVLTADWFWGAYTQLCADNQRSLRTYELFTPENTFNIEACKREIRAIADKQENLLLIFNTPGHNPTGYSMTDEDWDQVLDYVKDLVAEGKNKVTIAVDVAYLDYSGEREEVRRFFRKFSNLPDRILVAVCYSMSKGFTMYGQRMGALIGVSSNKDVIDEFVTTMTITSRATWSNCNRPAMTTLVNIVSNPEKYAEYVKERDHYCELIEDRAHLFMKEALECGLPILPYKGGFFVTVPFDRPRDLWKALMKEHIYIIPLQKGIRIATCSIPTKQIYGLAKRIKDVMDQLG